ncbi:hypothetical protein [Streptomyces sp. NPDC057199]|uniref:hypothetical protein n=1 Tax=Streptomyces sp. NPDC057199 TaxID=3346047 RepID=UPI003642F473
MLPELTRSDDDTLMLVPLSHIAPAPSQPQSMCWTWTVTRHIHEQIYGTVAEAFHAWGRSLATADLFGAVAVELAQGDVLSGPYLAVAVTLDEGRATLSAMSATRPEDTISPASPGHRPTSWGLHGQVGSTSVYAEINFARRPAAPRTH